MTTVHPKTTKKLMKEDELQLFLAKAEEWFEKNWRILVYAAIGIVVIGIVIWAMAVSKANANKDAGYDLADARLSLNKGEMSQATDKLKTIMTKRKGTSAAQEAALMLGRVSLFENKYDDAEKQFTDFLKKFPNEGVLSIGATNGLAVCYESRGKLKEAYDQYRKVYEMDKAGITAPQALYDAARVAIVMRDAEKAKLNALTLTRDFPTSTLRSQADELLSRTGR